LDTFIGDHDKSFVAAFTVILALSTIGLWLATNRLWEAGEKQIRVAAAAAEAAKKSADASLMALRPWVSCEATIISDLTHRTNGDPCITIRFTLESKGHSPAMGVRLYHRFHLLERIPVMFEHSLHAARSFCILEG